MARGRRIYSQDELFLQRCARRLRADLGVNAAGVEVILHMRDQLLEMQARLAALEAELAEYAARHGTRIALYHESSFEAIWTESDESE